MSEEFRPVAAQVKNRPVGGIKSEDSTRCLKNLIWLYLLLWLVEGGLRRWFLPSLAGPLLLVRDPLVLVIYFWAIAKNCFPFNGFVISGILLAVLTFANAMLLGHGNLVVAAYGLHCDFLHVPLIFIMGNVFTRKNLLNLAKIGLMIALPYTVLLVAQFYEPQSAWVNRGVGGSLEGAGFDGAFGHYRPPGTFSFITGTAQLYTLFTAFWFAFALTRNISPWLTAASGIAILLAIPVSVSRTLFLSVGIVAITGLGALIVTGSLSFKVISRLLALPILLVLLASQLPVFKESLKAFGSRWDASTTENGGFKGAVVDRVLDDLFGAFSDVQGPGMGTGFSTNVGQKVMTEDVGFGAAEAEWGRLLYDNGLFLGTLLVIYRTALAFAILIAAINSWRRGSPVSLIFASAAFLLLLNGQWKQSTTLGAAIMCGGLALAAARPYPKKTSNQSHSGGG